MRAQTALLLAALAAAAAGAWWYFSQGSSAAGGSTPPSSGSSVLDSISEELSAVGNAIGITPRGIRNNNPGNLDFIANAQRAWNGQIGADGRYGIYDTPANGVRAMSHQLQKDAGGASTLADVIACWAPPTENDTAAYVADVSYRTGIDPNAPLDLYGNLPAIVNAMIWHENGENPYNADDIGNWVYLS